MSGSFDPDQYFARQAGLASVELRHRSVVMIGAGAGSYLGEKIGRSVGRLAIVDFDTVELPNLSRGAYTIDDIGFPKAQQLAALVARANPGCTVVPVVADILALPPAEVDELVAGADLIIAGTDAFLAQARANVVSQRHGTPAVFVGVHDRGEGGRVLWSLPGLTPCFRCQCGPRYAAYEDGHGESGVDLPGATSLLVDIAFVDMVALKVALAVLERGCDSSLGRFFEHMADRTQVVVRTFPEHRYSSELWDGLLADLPPDEQTLRDCVLAMDTLWLSGVRDPDCTDCNGDGHRSAEKP